MSLIVSKPCRELPDPLVPVGGHALRVTNDIVGSARRVPGERPTMLPSPACDPLESRRDLVGEATNS